MFTANMGEAGMSNPLDRIHPRTITCTGLNGENEPSNVTIHIHSHHGFGATKFSLSLDETTAWLTPEEWGALCAAMAAEAEMSVAVDAELQRINEGPWE